MKARMESSAKRVAEPSPREKVINQLLALARTIRRRSSPTEAVVAAEFETLLAGELEKAKAA